VRGGLVEKGCRKRLYSGGFIYTKGGGRPGVGNVDHGARRVLIAIVFRDGQRDGVGAFLGEEDPLRILNRRSLTIAEVPGPGDDAVVAFRCVDKIHL